jgi:hypothetical protein
MGFFSRLFGSLEEKPRPCASENSKESADVGEGPIISEIPFDEKKMTELTGLPGTYSYKVVGTSHYQDILSKICGGKTPEGHDRDEFALLVAYENPHDPTAIGVLMGEFKLVGHLPREDARKWRIALRNLFKMEGCSLRVPAKIVGGWYRGPGDEGDFGVRLDLPLD